MALFPLVPDRVESTKVEFKTTIIDFETGYEQRSADWANGKKHFGLKWKVMNETDFDLLMDFFVARKGQYESFQVDDTVHPRFPATALNVRFADDAISFRHLNTGYSDVSVEVIVDA